MSLDYDFWVTPNTSPAGVTGSELVGNGTLEADASGWESDNVYGFYTPATFARTTSEAHTGTACLAITWPTASGASWVDIPVVGLEAGVSYTLSAAVKAPAGSPDPRLEVLGVTQGMGTSVKDEWVVLAVTFVATAASHKVGVRVDDPTGQSCYLDDASVKKAIVNPLGFNKAITTDRPYERATAQFRKDQLDSTPTVGDQSLTGWWTRGQFSFHKGAGVKYYEVLGSADTNIEGRFRSGEGVNPWMPGELRLANDVPAVPGWTAPVADAVACPYSITGDVAVQCFDDKVRVVDGSTISILYTATGNLRGIEASPADVWTIEDTQIIQQVAALTWLPEAGRAWRGGWWLKDRIFAVDDIGRWFTLAAGTSGTVAAADAFWAPSVYTADTQSPWVATESPSAIYIGRGRSIFRVTLDASGLVPAVTYAGVAALLPNGEQLVRIRYYLGRLVIVTTNGVRLAVEQGDGLVYGPLMIEGNFGPCGRIATQGNVALVTGVDRESPSTSPGLYEIDLSESTGDLTSPWVRRVSLPAGLGGATVTRNNSLYVYGGTTLLRDQPDSALVAYGSLTTGFHRFGTLEPKAFRLLRVKTEGTEGTVDVILTTPSGSIYVVGTVDAGDTAEFDLVSVGVARPLEYMSIKFVLNRGSGGTGPTLLGYQLKALPVPKRQRMIRVPLLLFDEESNRHGEAQFTDAWTRLAALEALEESSAVVSFEDKETGESGSGYIEAVEVSRTSPAGPAGSFGGFIYVTIRKI